MCEFCRQHKCPPMCPNNEPKVVAECAECGEDITEDNEFLIDDDGNRFCELDCVYKYYGVRAAHMVGGEIVKRKGCLL